MEPMGVWGLVVFANETGDMRVGLHMLIGTMQERCRNRQCEVFRWTRKGYI